MCVVALMTAIVAHGQFEKGDLLIGGSVLASAGSRTASIAGPEVKTTFFQVAPKAGYFVFNNLAAGMQLNYLYQSAEAVQQVTKTNETSQSFGVTPFLRYYFKPAIFIQASAGTSRGFTERNSNQTSNTRDFKSTIWAIGIGYAYFLSNSVAIEPRINYTSVTNDIEGTLNTTSLGIGIQVYLQKKQQ